jgi:hypothetical protein
MTLTFHPQSDTVACYDDFEVLIRTHNPIADPFRTVKVTASFDGKTIEGFCDSQDGSVYRVRFLATSPGEHAYTVSFTQGETYESFSGSVVAEKSASQGILRAKDWGFVWSETNEPFFWNSTTCYLMAGLSDEKIIEALDRLASFGVNRVRVSLCPSRQSDGGRWYESQVGQREDFSYLYSPWLCATPDIWDDPRPDTTRFDVRYWQKFERLLTHARKKNILVQVVFFTDAQEKQNYPFERPAPKPEGARDFDHSTRKTDENERIYYAYAAARFSAFTNVEWCLTNEWMLFQSNAWADEIGTFLREKDPYAHLMSVHGDYYFPFRESPWCTHALYQKWDESGSYDYMLKNRQEQKATGRVIPQVNDEYGYEDHYPGPWGGARVAPARNGESRIRLAWEMTMAGCHQTTGESAASGVGGWINGFGDKSELLLGHKTLKEFFEAIPNWQMLQPTEKYVLESATHRVIYDPESGKATVVSL